eukprot:jgi/Chrpa1/27367/Chrysochromulina_OHIO_Genome00025096-RA
MFTLPPKSSKPLSRLKATSQWSTTVPEPPPPKDVMPLISCPKIVPPCHTRTHCRVPESVGVKVNGTVAEPSARPSPTTVMP